MNSNKLLRRLLLLFPVFTLFQLFPLLGWINKVLLICVIVSAFAKWLVNKAEALHKSRTAALSE